MDLSEFQDKYNTAVKRITQVLESDKTVLAACLYGSANEGNSWVHSDIDIHVIVSDEKAGWGEVTLVQDEFIVNIDKFSREHYIRCIENRVGWGFLTASIFANSKLLFSKDPIFYELYDDVKSLGKKEAKISLLKITCDLILPMEKAYKHISFTKNLHRALPYILNIAEGFALLILSSKGIRPKKFNISSASEYEPELFKSIYYDVVNNEMSEQIYMIAIDCAFAYFRKNQEKYFEFLIEYLKSENRAFTVTEIDKYFSTGIHGTSTICEWLVKENLLSRASSPLKLTDKSNITMSEAAYFITY